MKIAVVHGFYSSETPSGENIVVEAQVAALRSAGYDVRLIAVRTDDLSHSPLYPVRTAVNVMSGRGASPMQKLLEFQPDVVHVHNLFPNIGTRWLSHWDGPIVATLHNYRPMCAAGILFRDSKTCTLCPDHGSHHAVIHGCYRGSSIATIPLAVRNRKGAPNDALLSRADRIILLSERSKKIYEAAGIKREKISVIPNFVEAQGFNGEAPLGRDWVYIGRLTIEKGVDHLMKYWPKGKNLRVFGDGPLLPRAGHQSARPDITFEGKISRAQVPEILANSAGLIFPSLCAEGAIPLTYVEALAAARPVVAYSGNGAADDIEAYGCGAIFSDWARLAVTLEKVESQRLEYSRKASTRFFEGFTSDRWLTDTSRLYSDVMAKRQQ